jgi:hypothetical protein
MTDHPAQPTEIAGLIHDHAGNSGASSSSGIPIRSRALAGREVESHASCPRASSFRAQPGLKTSPRSARPGRPTTSWCRSAGGLGAVGLQCPLRLCGGSAPLVRSGQAGSPGRYPARSRQVMVWPGAIRLALEQAWDTHEARAGSTRALRTSAAIRIPSDVQGGTFQGGSTDGSPTGAATRPVTIAATLPILWRRWPPGGLACVLSRAGERGGGCQRRARRMRVVICWPARRLQRRWGRGRSGRRTRLVASCHAASAPGADVR